ncbi:FAD-linked oxidase C-terminal domain-containing protein [endosymbiont of unidentified scaly snail isolate Monju]|uniref:FAD-linked oxidase C-terminal domain-containing protein n=1 Tax=endosymbiont of unidentified scaly snail isolate Monju TaxID=1248727 RepID=UPI00038924F1|nr:FAD-linked oxidase C-terminal domain-containing protein [endosymbiont of unidentified scaly snail isolate Monju]BAN69353.1 glycolate oxidase [endosymbiont of unidentified scaly snail isolate Monju]
MQDTDLDTLRQRLAARLRQHLDPAFVLVREEERRPYECDGLSAYRHLPLLVALPGDIEQVQAVMRICHEEKVPVIARGAGTGLSGGALPREDAVLLGLSRLNRILEVDPDNLCARVQPGVRNLAISEAVRPYGLYYAPDPSSQIACTIGGNVAENAGGVHCLKYGLTVNNLLALEIVTVEGERLRIGGSGLDSPGYDLLALLTGSEGMLGIVVEVTVKLLPIPQRAQVALAAFDDVEQAGQAVADLIAEGILPAGLEMMGQASLRAAEDFVHAGYPTDAAAFPAAGRISPDYYCMDGTIPRKHLARVLREIAALSEEYGLRAANVFHAGDGNLHPLILYDGNAPGELERAEEFGGKILELCVEVGGTITGEHGVGMEKINQMCAQFPPEELQLFHAIKAAFDPHSLLNPGKAIPTLNRCAEFGAMHVKAGDLRFPHLERF